MLQQKDDKHNDLCEEFANISFPQGPCIISSVTNLYNSGSSSLSGISAQTKLLISSGYILSSFDNHNNICT